MIPSETDTLAVSTVIALIVTVTEEEIGLSLHTVTSISLSDSDAWNVFCLKLISKTIKLIGNVSYKLKVEISISMYASLPSLSIIVTSMVLQKNTDSPLGITNECEGTSFMVKLSFPS